MGAYGQMGSETSLATEGENIFSIRAMHISFSVQLECGWPGA